MAAKEKRVAELEALMEEAHFWNNNETAQEAIAECNSLRQWTLPFAALKRRFEDVQALWVEAQQLADSSLFSELEAEVNSIDKGLTALEVRKMLAGEMDNKNCYLSINAGAGGTEACDWVLMLTRMYQRWASRRGWQCDSVDMVDGEVAGIKNITLKFTGAYAYGYSKAEKGVHRLVRISPFDSNARRHTSFASVDVTPEITDDIEINLRSEDVRVDTFRSSGAGGQHVNTTDSAVRVTHKPSGIVVSCQQERSQIQNRETCFKLLRSKLYEKEVMEREARASALGGEKKEIAWGSQIRNYVFQPYTLVKDARTKWETGNINAFMDGELDDCVNAFLKEFG